MRPCTVTAVALWAALLWAAAPAKTLDTLIIEGLQVNQASVVRNSAGLKQGRDFSASDVQDAVRSLYRLGLFRAVDFYVVEESDSSASLLVRLEEYPLCEAVQFSGNRKIKLKDLEEEVALRPGQVVSDQDLRKHIATIKDKYAKQGYSLADVQAEIVPSKVPGNAIVKFRMHEGAKVRVHQVNFTGNTAFKSKKLKRKFKTKEVRLWNSGKFEEPLYREHLDSLIMYYQNQGYLDARVARDSVWYSENKRDINIQVQIEEGRRFYAGDFFFAGNAILASDSLKGKVALKRGRAFEKDKFDMTKGLIEEAYREEGYLWVQVKDERAYRGDTIDVTMHISEGRPAVVRKIDISGNNKTRDKVVRRNIVLSPGQKYRQSLMSRSMREIMQLNYFNNVSPDLKPNEDGTIDLVFKVEEKDNVGQLSIGAAYSERDQFVGTFSTAIPNFRGNGQELTLNIEYGKYRRDFSVGFKEPWAFDRPISLQASVYYNKTIYSQYSNVETQSYGFRIGAGRKLKWPDDYFRLDGLYQISRDAETRPDTVPGEDGTTIEMPREGTMSRLSLTLYRNDTDVPTFPNRGSVFYLTPEMAGLGGNFGYLKATVGYDWYFPLFWKVVYGFKSKFGVVNHLPWSDTMVISRWDLFNAGGVYSDGTIRGYPEYTFGGHDNPSQGMTMLVLSSMLQFPVMERQLYLSLFADMGNTWSSVSQIDPTDMYKGVGFGVRLLVPMLGLMGFDFAWRLDDPDRTPLKNDAGSGADRFEFHFLMNRGF